MDSRLKSIALIFALCSASTVDGGITYEVVPNPSGPANGIVFSPTGGDLVVTNTLSRKEGDVTTDYFLNFGVSFARTDASGNVFFMQGPLYQLYVLDGPLPPPGTPNIVAEAITVGESEAVFLGAGRYEYHATLLGAFGSGVGGNLTLPGVLDFTFNTTLPLGLQVESGFVTLSAVPEPASMALMLIGGGIALIVYALGGMGLGASLAFVRRRERGE